MATIDHLVYAVSDLDAGIDALEAALGVRAAFGGRHEWWGTHNALADLGGGRYLEIIAPDPTQPAPDGPRPFGLDSITGPTLVAWAAATDDIDAAVAAARAQGHDPGSPIARSRARPDGTRLDWRLTPHDPADGVLPFLIEWGVTVHPSTTSPGGLALVTLTIETPDVAAVTAALAALDIEDEVEVAPADRAALVATIHGPRGELELR